NNINRSSKSNGSSGNRRINRLRTALRSHTRRALRNDLLEAEEEKGNHNEILDYNAKISLHEVDLAIYRTKAGKAAGVDGICNGLIKNGGYWMRASLCYMFNEVFDRHQVPSDWKNGLIVPFHKEGDRDRATNYRGITLLSNIGKIFAGILERRL